jgi:hypothetical protein
MNTEPDGKASLCLAVGDIPLAWYKDEDHVGYDMEGSKIIRKARKDALERLLDKNDSRKVSEVHLIKL